MLESLEPSHCPLVVEKLYCFRVGVLVKLIFVLLGCPFNFGCDHPNAKIPMDVTVMDIRRGIYYSCQYLLLKFLYPLDVTLTGTTPQLYSLSPDWFYDLVVCQYFVLY
jgi:hypothetical protein